MSRYVLYANGDFSLQYSSAAFGFFEYRGIYKEADGLVAFSWDAGSVWTAKGSLTLESLSVQYNEMMHQVDFYDGLYIRQSTM